MVGKMGDMRLTVNRCPGLIGEWCDTPVRTDAPGIIVKAFEVVRVYNQGNGIDQCDAFHRGEYIMHLFDLWVTFNDRLHLCFNLFDFSVNGVDDSFVGGQHLFQQRVVLVQTG